MQIYNTQNIIPAATILSADRTSVALQLMNMVGYSIQIVFTGTPTGTFKLQASADPVTQKNFTAGVTGAVALAPTNWTDIANSSFAVSAAGSVMWNVEDVFYNYVRVIYTDGSSGASTAVITSAVFNGKGI